MSYRLLYVLCEGNDDERFFEHVAKPQLQAHYDSIQYYQYAEETPKKVRRLARKTIRWTISARRFCNPKSQI